MFFKILDRALGLRMMARAGREFAIAHGAQFPAERLLGDRDPELLVQPLAKIDDPPAHDAMDRWRRPTLDDRGKRRPVRVIEPGRLPGALRSMRPSGPCALNFSTQSRTICSVTPPILAASVRVAPS